MGPAVSYDIDEIRIALNNRRGKWGHPYRFVFLNACFSGQDDLATAFGIDTKPFTLAHYANKGMKGLAYIGAIDDVILPSRQDEIVQHALALAIFWSEWMANVDVTTALQDGKDRANSTSPIDPAFRVSGATDLRRFGP